MKVAVAYDKGEIYGHFGHCETFAIYEYGEYVTERKKTLLETGERKGHEAVAALMKEQDVAAVLAGNMGPEARALLLSYGIVPVTGYTGDADTAADLLVTGRLPLTAGEGGCGGGCCGGGCCGGDSEDGCGGGCCGGESEGGCGCCG